MKTLQEQYNTIKKGQGNKIQFLKHARNLFPEYFNQYTNYDNAVSVLKSKQIISEAAGGVVGKGFDIWDWKKILAEETKAIEKETSKEVLDDQKNTYNNKDTKNADNVNFNEIMKGFYCEMKDEKNKDKTGDELKAMVVKNLAKDPLYYTKNGEFGIKGVGYTTEAPGLGTPKVPKGKHKASGYGDLKEGIIKEENTDEALNEASMPFSIINSDFSKDIVTDDNKIYISPKLAQSLESKYFSRGPSSYERTRSDSDKAKTAYLKIDAGFRGILRKGLKGANITELPKKNSDNTYKWVALSFPEKDYDITITDEKITINKKQSKENIAEQKLRSLIRNIIKEELTK